MCTSLLHRARLFAALVTDAPTQSRWLKSYHQTVLHTTLWRSLDKPLYEWNRSYSFGCPRQQQRQRQHIVNRFQQQLSSEVEEIMQQVRAEMAETVSGRIDMLSSVNTALRNASVKPLSQSHTESATSSREIRKAAKLRNNFEISCRTCTCGCKRGQVKER